MMDALSLGLLMEEEACRQQMEALFVGGVPRVGELLVSAVGPHPAPVGSVADEVAAAASRLLLSTEGPFLKLTREALGRGLESIREELRWCEQTLGPKYGGLADAACDRVDEAESQLVSLAQVQYRANASTVLGWFTQQLSLEIGLSLHLKEPAEVLVGRLVSPVPVRVEQHSGRGLWWKVLEHCNRITREIEFATVNAGRTEAMMQFNRLGEGR